MSVGWKLDAESAAELLKWPETGMGFQYVEGQVNGRNVVLLVFNAEDAYDVSDVPLADSTDPASILLNGTRIIQAIGAAVLQNDTLSVSVNAVAPPRTGGGAAGGAATPTATVAPPSSLVKSYALTGSRLFHRFSAFKHDRRVDKKGNFLAGTYATTDSDFPMVPSGFAAVGRFALPNIAAASYHFQIEAPKTTWVTTGTVAPAFGQAGGGVEAVFVAAVANGQSLPFSSKLADD